MPDNVKYCQFFQDDKQINRFLTMSEKFENVVIDEMNIFEDDENMDLVSDSDGYLNWIVDKEIIHLKNNCIPKGHVPLEKLFDNNDVAKNTKVTPSDTEVEDCNIGTERQPKDIKLSKNLSPERKEIYVKLMREYYDVFS